jgi:hypothetical protein
MTVPYLKFCFALLLAILFALFSAMTSLAYWTPMRTGQLPFTISPLEWTAFYSYVASLLLASLYVFASPKLSLRHAWMFITSLVILFSGTAWLIQRLLHFNALDPEKEEGTGLVIGCMLLGVLCGTIFSCVWPLKKRLKLKEA